MISRQLRFQTEVHREDKVNFSDPKPWKNPQQKEKDIIEHICKSSLNATDLPPNSYYDKNLVKLRSQLPVAVLPLHHSLTEFTKQFKNKIFNPSHRLGWPELQLIYTKVSPLSLV